MAHRITARPSPSPLATVALLAAAIVATGCMRGGGGGGGGTATTGGAETAKVETRPSRGNVLIIGLEQEPDKLNSALNAMVYGTYINNAIYGYLVKYDEKMVMQPELVTEIPSLANGGISADYLTYTYRLRPGLTWHDGHPFTSADVKFSWEAIMNPLHEVESRDGYDRVDRIETPDEHTVVIKLREPYAPFLEGFFFSEGLMAKHLLEGSVGSEFNAHQYHRSPVGLGPYRFEEWVTGSHVSIVPFEGFWRGKPSIDRITFRFIPDTSSLLVALQAEEIDGYDNAGTDQRPALGKIVGVKAHVTPQLMWEHIDFQCENPTLKDARVRRAIALGIDRQQIADQVYEGLWPVAHGDIAPSLSWYNPAVEQLVRYDPEAAKAMLAEAGWDSVGKDNIRRNAAGEKLVVTISTTAGRRQRELVEQVIQQQLKAIGVEIQIQNHNATAFFAPFDQDGVLKRGKFQLALYAWITSPDPNKRTLYHSSQVPPPEGQNQPRFKSARLDELIDAGLRELDPAKRKPIYDEIQVLLATEVPMTPIVWRSDVDVMTTRLQGFKPNPTQNGDTWNIWEWSLTP